jgi:Family of unknown function (DUF6077)
MARPRSTAPGPAQTGTGYDRSRLASTLDFVSDWFVLAFAAWTLIAYGGMLTDASATLLVSIWLATALACGVALVALCRSREAGAVTRPVSSPRPALIGPERRPYVVAGSIAAGVASGIVAASAGGVRWAFVWAGAFISVALAVGLGRLRSTGPPVSQSRLRWPVHGFAALVGLCFAGVSLFLNRPNADDTFYINRATATEELNRIPVRDVLFTNEQVGPTSGAGLPVDSFHALQGALARVVDLQAPSVAYYVTLPLLTFLATWALWRLLRSWAPGSVLLCFALGCTYWIFSAGGELTAGSYFLTRLWQGKVAFVAFLVMTAYVHLTRWLAGRDVLTAALLLAVGISSIGMTSSATFVVPLLFAAAAVPLLAGRDWRDLPVVAAAAAIPFLIGVVVTLEYPLAEQFGGQTRSTPFHYHQILGAGVLAAVGAIGLWAAPWLARAGPPARLTTGIAIVAMLLLAPRVLPTLGDAAELANTLRRTLWIIPLPAVVGLLGAVPVAEAVRRLDARRRLPTRLVAAAPALLAAGLLVAFGDPLWKSPSGESWWVERPSWKVNAAALEDARGILRGYRGNDPVLASQVVMSAIVLETVSPKPVNGRLWYSRILPEPRPRRRERRELTEFVTGRSTMSRMELRRALSDLQVGLICPGETNPRVIGEVEAIGGYRRAFEVRGLVCFQRAGIGR